MTALKPNQALFLWRMITAETQDVREPALSKAKPDIGKDKRALIENGYLETEKRGRSNHLLLTDKAWAWAGEETGVQLMKSNSRVGADALEGLLHRLLPFLQRQEIALAALFMEQERSESDEAPTNWPQSSAPPASGTLPGMAAPNIVSAIEQAYLSLSGGQRKVRVMLRDLRPLLSNIAREDLDRQLVTMLRAGQLVLYREDNTAALTAADHEAAIQVGDAPRHLVYLEDRA